jgi:5-methylcytosine-specific restriction protein B
MSRYCGPNSAIEEILAAADHWKGTALLSDGSVFSDRQLWTLEGMESLENNFINNLDDGQGSYWDKLRRQLEGTSQSVKQLSSEMNWLMMLCPSNIQPYTKRQAIRDTWESSGQQIPDSAQPWLNDRVLEGVGSAGAGYNNHRWRELRYCIKFCLAFKRLPFNRRAELLQDSWQFGEWLQEIPENDSRQFRHMLVFLLFPDSFERIFGGGDRANIVLAFGDVDRARLNRMTALEIDRKLGEIRVSQEREYGTQNLDFYLPPLRSLWEQPDFATVTNGVTREHVLRALGDIDDGNIPDRSNSTTYDLINNARRYPPKLVLSLAVRHASGEEYDRDDFTGGEQSPAFRLLRNLGFEIVEKRIVRELVEKFLAQARASQSLVTRDYPNRYRKLDVKLSFGAGVFARIPWISFLGPGQSTSNGIYPVILFYKEQGILVLAYGVSETETPRMAWTGLDAVQTVREYFQSHFNRIPQRYGYSYVAKVFDVNDETAVDFDSLTFTLDELIDHYRMIFDEVGDMEAQDQEFLEEHNYSTDEALKDLFIPDKTFGEIISRLRQKKALVLQGPPGVGKTFVARRIAYALMSEKAPSRVGMVQFHQAYSYEDFIQGYRPSGTGFFLKNGTFFEFCKRAENNPEKDYVFIIDEINRANLSKVLGEVMMLIEADKRGPEWAIPLTYSESQDDLFHVPENLYLIGLMNTADRSLAMVDYALRRRFAFIDIQPAFSMPKFSEFLETRGVDTQTVERIFRDISDLNIEISKDKTNLGEGFCIGHSFFCPSPNADGIFNLDWYHEVIRSEILPLLKEYWFDDPAKLENWERQLLGE